VDVVARYGGEEFGIILPQFSHNQAVRQAEAVRQAVAREEIIYDHARISMTISLGVATFPLEATTGRALMRMTDGRLYKAKGQGRNRVVAEDK
jgi:diguanylate cyclase (GGDEF)-like protein